MIQKPFEIRSILPYFPPYVDDTAITDGMICIVIGFTPTTARETYHHSKELAAYIRDNHVLDGFHLAEHAMFHCGIEWQPDVDSGSETTESSKSSDSSETTEASEEYSDNYEDDMEESHPIPDELP